MCRFASGRTTEESYLVSADGVEITVSGEGEIGFALPAFYFDGEKLTEICADGHELSVRYDGWACRYTTDGEIIDLNKKAANRNGHYSVFVAGGKDKLKVSVRIECD